MSAKRVTFDPMNLGCPVHSDPFEIERDMPCPPKRHTHDNLSVSDKELREKLLKEAKNVMPDFFVKDPSSSDDSDDYEYPETICELVRRMSFARRRTLHYNEFATVELARRLVCVEFASETSSVRSEDSAFLPQVEECRPCVSDSAEGYQFLQYERASSISQESNESECKDDPEPGFDPSHHCYHKLMGDLNLRNDFKPEKIEKDPKEQKDQKNQRDQKEPTARITLAQVNKDLQDSMERRATVMDKGEKWDLERLKRPTPESPKPSLRVSKLNRKSRSVKQSDLRSL